MKASQNAYFQIVICLLEEISPYFQSSFACQPHSTIPNLAPSILIPSH